MTSVPPWLTVQSSEDGESITVALDMPRDQALGLASVLARAADTHAASRIEAERLRSFARQIQNAARIPGIRRHAGVYKVVRPSNKYRSDSDIDHVLHGSAPFPVLSPRDMAEVYPHLERRGMTADAIAERLYLAPRTVSRWRSRARAKEDENDATDTTGRCRAAGSVDDGGPGRVLGHGRSGSVGKQVLD